jgi:hypothetical protein
MLTATPPETDNKASVGWYAAADFRDAYRDSSNLISREALTLDYDKVSPADVKTIQTALEPFEYAIYTTWSHSVEAPRIRVVMPLARGVTADEFCAISRWIASLAGIELASRESHVPAQMMFLPARKPGAAFKGRVHKGAWINVEDTLAQYADWTDRSQWPHRSDGDSTHHAATAEKPTDKEGIVGEFCRAFDVPAAISKFALPYVPTASPDRWTYTLGHRPEGAILYDDGQKLHSHHDTDPARGQNNSFDLVRLHKFGTLDKDSPDDAPTFNRPSYAAMCEFAESLGEVRAVRISEELEDLGPLPDAQQLEGAEEDTLARPILDWLLTPTRPRWLIRDTIEREIIHVMAGKRGAYKSFIALDWSCRVATNGHDVYVISGEGGDYDRRLKAWCLYHKVDPRDVRIFLAQRRLDLSNKEGINAVRRDCVRLGIRPSLFVLDTYSKLSGGLDENDNSLVKQFVGLLDNGLKRATTGFGATILLVAHTGHGDAERPRGASALAADTDAESIVKRNDDGTVSSSRERFKSSPELEPLRYRPEVVQLGYQDDEGKDITSLVMVPTVSDAPLEKATPGAPVKNATHKAILDEAKEMLRAGPMDFDALATLIAERRPKIDEKRDTRLQAVRRALQTLSDGKNLHRDGSILYLFRPARAVQVDELEELA